MVRATTGSRAAKAAMFDVFARVASGLAAGRRLEIIDVLAQAPRSVEELAAAIDQSVANTSHHLRRMAGDGLVARRREGRRVVYRLASDRVYDLWRALQDVAASHHGTLAARVDAYVGKRGPEHTIDPATFRDRLERGEVLVIDVRPPAEYGAGHIEGAISVPPDRLDESLAELPAGGDVVAYCRGRYCAFADEAVRRLRAAGRRAFRLEAGYRDWAGPSGDAGE